MKKPLILMIILITSNLLFSQDTITNTKIMESKTDKTELSELDLKMKDLEIRQKEFELKQSWTRSTLPLIITFLLSLITAYFTAQWSISTELKKVKQEFKQSSIKEIVVSENLSDARKKINFLIQSKLIEDAESDISNALEDMTYESEALENFLNGSSLVEQAKNEKDNSRKLELYKKAIIEFSKSIDLDSKNHTAFRGKGFCYQKLGFLTKGADQIEFFNKSTESLDKAIAIKDSEPHYYLLRGTNRMNNKDYGGAKKDFFKSLELNPNHVNADYYLGVIFLIEGKNEESKNHFVNSFKKNPIESSNNFLSEFKGTYNYDPEYACRLYNLMKEIGQTKLVDELDKTLGGKKICK